MNYTNLRTKIK